MRRTGTVDVAAAFVLLAVLTYAAVRFFYDQLPTLPLFMAVPVALLAVAVFVAASRVRGAVDHQPGYKPVTALSIARGVALAKACLLGGSALAGAMTGLLVRVLPDLGRTDAARHDTVVGIVVLAVSLALAVGGWRLERAAVDPVRRRR